jgi:sugar phosphate isomerase/epimerase
MSDQQGNRNKVSRRKFLGLTAAAAAYSALPHDFILAGNKKGLKGSKPDSLFGGVQIGAITYSWRSMPCSAEDILNYCIQTGISSIELMGDAAENFAGLPPLPKKPDAGTMLSDSELAKFEKATKDAREEQKAWRIKAPMKKFEELRKMYNDAGVSIHIAKFSPENWSEKEIEYAFHAAKALGAAGVSNEIGDKACQLLGPIAQKERTYAIFHQHGQPGEPGWNFDKFLDYSPSNMLNFDAGHFFGATGIHPNEIIERLHKRIVSVHLKDKTGPKSSPANTNMPWGKGETPIADILLLIKKNKWPIYADIELEYPVPENSDAIAEVRKCVEFCKNILA